MTTAMMGFLARWARRRSWRETAQVFQVRWEAVYRSVAWFVAWGLAPRELKEAFAHFGKYRSGTWAGAFLDYWTWRAMRSRLEPMKKVARMLRAHEPLLLNWFRAQGEISAGAIEGLNNKIRVITRRSYGFRTFEAMEVALYHTLGRLPEPESTHRYC